MPGNQSTKPVVAASWPALNDPSARTSLKTPASHPSRPAASDDDSWTVVQKRRPAPNEPPEAIRAAPQPPVSKVFGQPLGEYRKHLQGRSGREISSYVASLRSQNRHREVEAVLMWALEQPEHRQSLFLYNQLLHAVRRDIVKLEAVRSRMKRARVPNDRITSTTIIDAYGKAGQLAAACAAFEEMEQAGIHGDAATFSSLITAAAAEDDVARALWVFGKMRGHHCGGDAQIYNVLIHLFSRAAQPELAWDIFDAMEQNGVAGNVVTFNTLIDMCVKNTDFIRGWHTHAKMIAQKVKPDVKTYNILISLCGKTQEPQRASNLLDDMQHEGIEPDIITMSTLIDIFAKLGELELMVQAFVLMRAKAMQPNAITCTTFVSTCYAAGKFELCLDALGSDVLPVDARAALAEIYRRLKNYPKASQLCDEVIAATPQSSDSHHRAWIIKQYIAQLTLPERTVRKALGRPPFGPESPHWPRFLSVRVFAGLRDDDVGQQAKAIADAMGSVDNTHALRDLRRAMMLLGVKKP